MIVLNLAHYYQSPPTVMPKRRWLLWLGCISGTILISFVSPAIYSIYIYKHKTQLALMRISDLNERYTEIKSRTSMLDEIPKASLNSEGGHPAAIYVYQRLQDILPKNVWLDSVHIEDGGQSFKVALISRNTKAGERFAVGLRETIEVPQGHLKLTSVNTSQIEHRDGGWFRWGLRGRFTKHFIATQSKKPLRHSRRASLSKKGTM